MPHPRPRSLVSLVASLLLVPALLVPHLALAGSLSQAGEETPPLAQLVAAGGRVEWVPGAETGPESRWVLAVADPAGQVRSATFAAGEAVAFPLVDPDGAALPDGLYTYELRTIEPVPGSLRTRLERARLAGNEALIRRLEVALPPPRVQSGAFRVADGALVIGEGTERNERLATKDQTVPDDLIVDGKGCIGLGCAANEGFFQEALRLKQSVVRLRFEDTSSQAGFPSGDWQLTLNDATTANGGINRFSLDDLSAGTTPLTVQGGAPSSSLVVDAQGRLGLGTSVPAQRFHLLDAGTPALRFEKSGGTPRTWDLAADASSFRLVDQSNSGAVPVQIAAGAPTNSFLVTPAGWIGIGVNPPVRPFHLVVNLPGDVSARMQNTSSSGFSGIEFAEEGGTPSFFFGVDNGNNATRLNSVNNFPMLLMTQFTERLKIQANGNIALGGLANATHPLHHANGAYLSTGGVWTSVSSRRFKQDIRSLDAGTALSTVAALQPVSFAYKANPEEHHVGFIAEDVPDLVASQDRTGLSPMDIVAVLTKVVQEQQKKIAAQEEMVQRLEARLAALERERQTSEDRP